MVEQKLVDYVNSAMKSGQSADQVKTEMLKQGWPEKDVNQALSMAQGGGKATRRPVKGEKKPEKGHKHTYIIAVVVIILIMGATSYYIYNLTVSGGGKLVVGGEKCGNAVCDPEENYINCPDDCQQPPPPAGPQKVSVSPATQTVSNGDTFTVEIKISDANDLYGYQFNIEYDPNILRYEKTEEGGFLGKRDDGAAFPLPPKVSEGLLKDIANTRLGAVGGLNGEGTLEIITFTALNTGTSEIKISNIKFVNSRPEIIETSGENGQVVVS